MLLNWNFEVLAYELWAHIGLEFIFSKSPYPYFLGLDLEEEVEAVRRRREAKCFKGGYSCSLICQAHTTCPER
jgi:hypothetical protein